MTEAFPFVVPQRDTQTIPPYQPLEITMHDTFPAMAMTLPCEVWSHPDRAAAMREIVNRLPNGTELEPPDPAMPDVVGIRCPERFHKLIATVILQRCADHPAFALVDMPTLRRAS